ncbi:GAF domain-containing protein [Leptolyngbya sp. FACHB-261]|uniref:sensor histidine kinase n=1 Tax=Leptolyngbya sp. FACHB-261 TaxID=2692806 RepID=UPI001682EBDA|nr:GAF domain-containing protein [Leptolyngbya sp. FACHB-261]MBD2103560.1 GAF domain-containing protein [Leptolyngbya sp. FACHB-261]
MKATVTDATASHKLLELSSNMQQGFSSSFLLTPEHSLSEVAAALLKQGRERLPVVAQHQLLGWVAQKTLLAWLARGLNPVQTHLSQLLDELELSSGQGLAQRAESQVLTGLPEASLRLGGSFGEVCDQAVTVLASLFEVAYVTIERLRPDPIQGARVEIVSVLADGQLHHGGELPLAGSPSEQVYQTGQVYTCHGELRKLFPTDIFLQSQQLRAYLGCPLLTPQGYVWGILHLMDRHERPFAAEELRLLRIFTERLSTEWEQERHSQRLEQQAQRQRLVYQIATDIRSSLNLKTVLRRAVARLGEALQVDRCVIRLVGEARVISSGQDFFEYCQSPWPSVRQSFADHGAVTEDVLRQQRLIAIADVEADERIDASSSEYRHSRTRSLLVVPLLCRAPESNEALLVGIAYLNQCARVRHWTVADQQLAQEVSGQLATAIQQATLYKQAQQHARQEALVNQISSAIRSSLDPEAILEQTVQLLGAALNVDLCVIAIGSLDQEAFTQIAAWKRQGRASPPSRTVTIDNSHIQALIHSPDPIAVADIRQATELDQAMRERFESWQIRASLAVATRFGREINGMLGLYQYQARSWRSEEIEVLRAVADQTAIAIHQAQLYQKIQLHNQLLERQVQERTEQLQLALAQAQHLNELKDNFLSTISHELRTPLTSMKMALQMLRLDTSPEKQERYWQILNDQCQYEIDLVNNLLDLQRLEANTQETKLEPISLELELHSITEGLQSSFLARQLRFTLSMPQHLPLIYSDLCSLRRVVHELLSNARKYTPTGGEIALQVSLEATQEGNCLQLQVLNSGPGITPQDLDRIFDKFYRCQEANRQAVNGTGLGLPLVKKLLESLSGQIKVSSFPGQTCFQVRLPLVVVAE